VLIGEQELPETGDLFQFPQSGDGFEGTDILVICPVKTPVMAIFWAVSEVLSGPLRFNAKALGTDGIHQYIVWLSYIDSFSFVVMIVCIFALDTLYMYAL
jgi:hypothetical protein